MACSEPDATPTTATFDYPIPRQVVARRYFADDGERLDALAGVWAAVFYLSWAALLLQWLPPVAFAVIGLVAFIRNFNALHEAFHARRRRDRAWLGRVLMVVTSPLMLSYGPLRDNHLQHHTWAGQAGRDPDHYLLSGPWHVALLHALTQPEQGVFRYVRRCGWSWRLATTLLGHTIVFGAIAFVGWGAPLLWWVGVTRVGNAASWFIFDWCLHHPRRWGDDGPPGLPAPLRWVWVVLLSRDNLYGVEFHHVHHQYPFVRDADLPRLSEELLRCG